MGVLLAMSSTLMAGDIWVSPKVTLTSALRQAREWRRTGDERAQGGINIYIEGGTYTFHEPIFIRPEAVSYTHLTLPTNREV